jgi:ABC-2 type transport system ATP-binding protein
MTAAISVEDVSKHYGAVVALDHVDLAVPEGSILGLVGPNGAGKTTLIRILVGALRPDTGIVRVLGMDPLTQRHAVRSRIGYMPQAAVLYDDLTVRENVTFFARGHEVEGIRTRVGSVLDFVDLDDAADRQVATLSGGQQQRASLAVALVHEPDVLYLDEPTAGVDPELRRVFWGRFRELARSGTTVVVSTHQMDEVVHCDRVALIRSATVLAESTPSELFASGGATIRVFLDGKVAEYHVDSTADGLPEVLRGYGLDDAVTGIDVAGPTLEEVILRLIDRQDGDAG